MYSLSCKICPNFGFRRLGYKYMFTLDQLNFLRLKLIFQQHLAAVMKHFTCHSVSYFIRNVSPDAIYPFSKIKLQLLEQETKREANKKVIQIIMKNKGNEDEDERQEVHNFTSQLFKRRMNFQRIKFFQKYFVSRVNKSLYEF